MISISEYTVKCAGKYKAFLFLSLPHGCSPSGTEFMLTYDALCGQMTAAHAGFLGCVYHCNHICRQKQTREHHPPV